MHRIPTRHVLASSQGYICLACSLRSSIGPGQASASARQLATPSIDPEVTGKLEKEINRPDAPEDAKQSGKNHSKSQKGAKQSLERAGQLAAKAQDLVKRLEASQKKSEASKNRAKRIKKSITEIVGRGGNQDLGHAIATVSQASSSKGKAAAKSIPIELKEVQTRLRAALAALEGRYVSDQGILSKKTPVIRKVQSTPSSIEDQSKSYAKHLEGFPKLLQVVMEYAPTTKSRGREKGSSPGQSQASTKDATIARKVKSKTKGSDLKKSSSGSKTPKTSDSLNLGPGQVESMQSGSIPVETINTKGLELTPIPSDQPPVPKLAYGLDRVLFNPGVYQLQDSRTKVYNFDPYLQNIMPVSEFDFNSLKEYITSSKDTTLGNLAKGLGKRYVGSTSSMTSTLSHFHYLLSQWRPINADRVSASFPAELTTFTQLQRAPTAVFLKWQDGVYSIDADKEHANSNILSMLGKSMEKLLTLDTDEFERYRKSSLDKLSDEEKDAPEAYHFSTMGDFLMRSQLDAYDPRLPGTGMFDLKTRAVVSIRMNVQDYEALKGYEITDRFGEFESYEREYFDMIRAAFLKYSLQVRMGRMDGIFVAFHNTERIFGFQYVPLGEMDHSLHGQTDLTLGDEEFKHSLNLLNKVLETATKRYPDQTIRFHFETRPTNVPFMYIFAEPVSDVKMQELQMTNQAEIDAFEREILGLDREPPSAENDDQWQDITQKVDESVGEEESGEQELVASMGLGDASVEEGSDSTRESEEGHDNELASQSEDDEGPGRPETLGVEIETELDQNEEELEQDIEDEAIEEVVEQFVNDVDPSVEDTAPELPNDSEHDAAPVPEVALETESDDIQKESVAGADGLADDTDAQLEELDAEIERENLNAVESSSEDVEPSSETAEHELLNSADDTEKIQANADNSEPIDANTASRSLGSSATEAGSTFEAAVSGASIGEVLTRYKTSAADKTEDKTENIIEDKTQEEPRPLLAMTLTIRNKIGGKYVQRPENLTRESVQSQPWNVEYALAEIAENDRAWRLYRMCKKRRSQVFGNKDPQERYKQPYVRMLRDMSKQREQIRMEQNEAEKDHEKVVFGEINALSSDAKDI
ncbi:MAG: hypothetical protein MMC23_005899 [Stictis urceolatum]|nr:hypothetical protein [Stictis urceolata]